MTFVQVCASCKGVLGVAHTTRVDGRYALVCDKCFGANTRDDKRNMVNRRRYNTDPDYRQKCVIRARKNRINKNKNKTSKKSPACTKWHDDALPYRKMVNTGGRNKK